MAWNLAGSYSETCSCELMCPCNMSFDHGATYDFCRVTLAFHVHEGSVDGTDIAGRKVVLIADTPKVMTDGNWRVGVRWFGGALVFAAVVRAVLPAKDAGMLAVRKRWWDCLLLASALELGCTHFLSEDLQDGQVIEGLTIVNPFAHTPEEILSPR